NPLRRSPTHMSALEDLSSAIRAVSDTAGSAVVGIGRGIRGSGVVIADGRVLTNAHNLRGDEVTVTFRDGRSTVGKVRGVDPDGDLAVVEVDTSGAKALAWSEAEIGLGDVVFGLAATGAGPARVTVGYVSAVERTFRGPGGSGIGEGDLLVEAAGKALDTPDALPEILAESGLPIELKIVRGDEERSVSVGGTTDASGEA